MTKWILIQILLVHSGIKTHWEDAAGFAVNVWSIQADASFAAVKRAASAGYHMMRWTLGAHKGPLKWLCLLINVLSALLECVPVLLIVHHHSSKWPKNANLERHNLPSLKAWIWDKSEHYVQRSQTECLKVHYWKFQFFYFYFLHFILRILFVVQATPT